MEFISGHWKTVIWYKANLISPFNIKITLIQISKIFFKQTSLNHFLNNLCQLKYLVRCVWKVFKMTKEIQCAKDSSLINGLLIFAFFQRPWWVAMFDERQQHSKSSFLMTEINVANRYFLFVKTWKQYGDLYDMQHIEYFCSFFKIWRISQSHRLIWYNNILHCCTFFWTIFPFINKSLKSNWWFFLSPSKKILLFLS